MPAPSTAAAYILLGALAVLVSQGLEGVVLEDLWRRYSGELPIAEGWGWLKSSVASLVGALRGLVAA